MQKGQSTGAAQRNQPVAATSPFDDSNVLAKDLEEGLLWRDMNNDLVNQIMRRLSHHQAEKPRPRRRRVMLLKGEQLAAHLERELRPLYVLYGDEPLLVLEAADAIRAKARQKGYSEREVLTVLPHFDWGQLLAAGGNMSLFGDKKLIDLRIPTGKPGKEGGAALQEWCQHLSLDNLLLITLPELDWREEKAVWFTAWSMPASRSSWTAPPLAELPGWIAGRLRRQQQSADLESLKFIAERVEGNLLAAHQEIQKLGLLYPAGTLTPRRFAMRCSTSPATTSMACAKPC
jgi:hypothetical protein